MFYAIGYTGIGKPKAAAAAVLFQPTGGQPGVAVSSVQYLVHAPQTSPNSCSYAISADSTSGLSGDCVPELALGPKSESAVTSISAHQRPEVAPPHPQYPHHRTLPKKLVSATGAAGTANRTAAEVLYQRFLKVAEVMAVRSWRLWR